MTGGALRSTGADVLVGEEKYVRREVQQKRKKFSSCEVDTPYKPALKLPHFRIKQPYCCWKDPKGLEEQEEQK